MTPSSEETSSVDSCVVCGDKAIGAHYKILSCNGCKGFFRRSIFHQLQYTCRFNGQCTIDRNNRNSCRSCRLQQRGAIQNERDRIGSTKRAARQRVVSARDDRDSSRAASTIEERDSESDEATTISSAFDSTTTQTSTSSSLVSPASAHLIATLTSIEQRLDAALQSASGNRSCRQHAVQYLLGYTSSHEALANLPFDDKVLVLKNGAAAFALWHVLQRSIGAASAGCPQLIMPNSVTRLSLSTLYVGNVSQILGRIANELLAPLRRLAATRDELAIIKSLLLLPTDLVGLSTMARDVLREARDTTTLALFEQRVAANGGDTANAAVRSANLMLLVSLVFELGRAIVDSPSLAPLFGLTEPQPAPVAADPTPPLAAFSIVDQTRHLDLQLLSSATVSPAHRPPPPPAVSSALLNGDIAALSAHLIGQRSPPGLVSTASPPLVDALRSLSSSALPDFAKSELKSGSTVI